MGRRFFAIAAIVQRGFTFLCGAAWAAVNALVPSGVVFNWILYEGGALFEDIALFCIPHAIICLGLAILLPHKAGHPTESPRKCAPHAPGASSDGAPRT